MKRFCAGCRFAAVFTGALVFALPSFAGWQAGLNYGVLDGNKVAATNEIPETKSIQLSPHVAEYRTVGNSGPYYFRGSPVAMADATGVPLVGNQTQVYRGQIFSPGATFNFGEYWYDYMRLTIDGNPVIATPNYNQAYTGSVYLSRGWHDIDIRFTWGGGNGGNRWSTTGANGTDGPFGFGMNIGGVKDSVLPHDYAFPRDPGDMTLFRCSDGQEGSNVGITVFGRPALFGVATPTIGFHAQSVGETVTCTMSSKTSDGADVERVLTGYRLTDLVTGEETEGTGNSVSYVQGEHEMLLEWIYAPDTPAENLSTCYVSSSGSDSSSGATPGLGKATLAAAVAAVEGRENATVILGAGVYRMADEIFLTNAVRIVGAGRDKTILEGPVFSRGFTMNHPDAILEDLTLSNACLRTQTGLYSGASSKLWPGAGGGGIYIGTRGGTVRRCRITRCEGTAQYIRGGGVRMFAGRLENCIIDHNTSLNGDFDSAGGGLSIEGGVAENCLIYGNTAQAAGGVLVTADFNSSINALDSEPDVAAPPRLIGCTITDNQQNGTGHGNCRGGGVRRAAASSFVNCIVTDNRSYKDAYLDDADYFDYQSTDDSGWTNCALPKAHGVNTVTASVLFVNPSAADFSLSGISPCVNAGLDAAVMTEKDVCGNPRIIGEHVDIGAIECRPPLRAISGEPVAAGVATPGYSSLTAAGTVSCSVTTNEPGVSPVSVPLADGSRVSFVGYEIRRVATGEILASGTSNVVDYPEPDDPTCLVWLWTRDTVRTQIYVDQEAGDDENDGFDAARPVKTVNRAVAKCPRTGDIHISAGTYALTRELVLNKDVRLFGAGRDKTVFVPATGVKTRLVSLNDSLAAISGVTVSNVTFAVNASEMGTGWNVGGGMGIWVGPYGGTVSDCRICYCRSEGGGQYARGALRLFAGRAERCIIDHNESIVGDYDSRGAGVQLDGGTLVNSLVYANKAQGVGGICLGGGSVVNCTVVSNFQTTVSGNERYWGSGIRRENGTVLNTIVWDNVDAWGSSWSNNCYGATTDTKVWRYVASQDPVGANAVTDNPMFKNAARGNCRLYSRSPLVDKGSPEDKDTDAAGETDLDGDPRVRGKAIDIGCYEAGDAGFCIFVR